MDLFVNGPINQSNIPDQHVMTWQYDGNVGIGTPTPNTILDIYNSNNTNRTLVRISGSQESSNSLSGLLLGAGGMKGRGKGAIFFQPYGTTYGFGKLHFAVNETAGEGEADLGDVRMTITGSGSVGIGTTVPNAKLAVNGDIRAKEIKVETVNWPDYVFRQTYKLPSLTIIEAYIGKNKHLPDVPSEAEVAKEGVNLGEMNKLLLKKVEELTLHLIRQQKQIDQLNRKIKANTHKSI